MALDIGKILLVANRASVPRKICQGRAVACCCGDYPKRMHAFHKEVTPEVVLELVERINSFTESGFAKGINWLWCERDRLMRKAGERK